MEVELEVEVEKESRRKNWIENAIISGGSISESVN